MDPEVFLKKVESKGSDIRNQAKVIKPGLERMEASEVGRRD